MAEPTNAYQPRVIAFIDILGFKDLVRRIPSEPRLVAEILEALQFIHQIEDFAMRGRGGDAEGTEMTAFSDCWVLSNEPDKILEVASAARSVATRLLQLGLPTRGSIVIGDAYHRGRVVFGDAMIQAYETEQGGAMYPRIVATDEVAEAILEQERDLKVQPSILKRDRDGCWFLDLFTVSAPRWKAYHISVRSWLAGTLNNELGSKPRNLGRLAKLRWLTLQFNESIAEKPEEQISVLDLDLPERNR